MFSSPSSELSTKGLLLYYIMMFCFIQVKCFKMDLFLKELEFFFAEALVLNFGHSPKFLYFGRNLHLSNSRNTDLKGGSPNQGILKGGRSITVPLTSCLTGLDKYVLQIKRKIVSCHTADSKPVKQEVNSTVILPPLVFPAQTFRHQTWLEVKLRPQKALQHLTGEKRESLLCIKHLFV